MEKVNPVRDKSYLLGLEVMTLSSYLQKKREYVLSKQLLKSGTSVGANIAEALQAQSRPDFIAKLSISHKEASETEFWIRLLIDSGRLTKFQTARAAALLREVLALLTSILKTTKAKGMKKQ
jgi:four helix bundle protein